MPPLAAAVAAYLTISIAMAYVVIAAAVITLASVAYSAYMMASMEKPNQPDSQKRLNTVRSSIQPHRVIYGEVMTGGILVYAQSHSKDPLTLITSDKPNEFISLVVAFTGHEIDAIKEVWLNDKISTDNSFVTHVPYQPPLRIPMMGPGSPLGTIRDEIQAHDESWVHITKYTGTLTQVADPFLVSLPPKPTTVITNYPTSGLNDLSNIDNANGDGTYSAVGMSVFSISIDSTGAIDTFKWSETSFAGDGTTVIDIASGSNVAMTAANQLLHNGITIKFAAVTGHSLGQIWEIRAYDGMPWTSDCTLTGRSYIVVTLQKNDTVFPNGLPNIKALIRGNNQIYDPRTATTGYSNNWALCVRDYLTKSYGLNAPIGDINDLVSISAANICDESITLANGTIQKRYDINGSFTVDKTPTAIMNEILATAYGAITWTQGQYRILPAAYYTPDMTFHGLNPNVPGLTESDLRGQIKVRPIPSMKDKFNTVKGTYISTETWQSVDFPKVTNSAYVAQDGGEEIVKDIQLSYVTDSARAQRIAKIMLEKSRQGISVDFPAKWSAFPLAVGENVPISIDHLGWIQKIFTVRDWKMNPDGGVDLMLQEDAIGCYSWNNGEQTIVDLAPNTILPDPRYVAAPKSLIPNIRTYDINSGTNTRVDLYLVWTAGDSKQVQYQVQYQDPDSGSWFSIPDTIDTVATISGLHEGTYNVRVRAINSIGATSDWAIASQYIPLPDTTVPNVTGLELFGQGNDVTFVGKDINLRWNYVSPRGDTTLVGPGRGSSWFKYYIIKVYTTGGVLRRTDWSTTENYTYTYDMNRKDGIDVAIRNVRFDVTILTSWNAESAVPATITVNNPNIIALPSLTLTGAVNLLSVALPLPSEGDFTGFLVHASQTANFTPDASNQINKGGPETVVTKINMTPGTWYVKAAGYDSFGTDGANYSAQYQVNVDSLTVTPELLDSIQRVDFYIRNSNFYFTTSTLNWSAGYIDRDTTTYTLAAGTMATANTSYIIATCDAGVVTLSKVAVGTGLPSLATNQVVIALTSDYTTPQGNYYCYVRQANSVAIEGALIRNATITDAHITGTLSANRIQSLNGATQISGAGITLNDYSNDLIQIGGRNLLLNSDFGKATPPAGCTISNGKATFTSVALGQSIILSLSMSPQFLKLLAGDLFIGSARFSLSNIVAGPTNFWLGCELAITYSDATHDWIDIGGGNSLGVGTKSEFLQSNNSYTIPAGKIIYQVDCTIIMRDCTGTFTVQSPKWEEGNKATSWTPAPEDVDSSIATAATTANWSGIDVPIRFADAPVGAGLCITPTYMGYYNGSAWKTYQDNQGNLYLSGDNGRGLTWTAATSQLDIISGSTTGKRVSISGSDNEIHFFDDIGNGTIGEMVTLGAFSADGSGLYARTSYGIKSTSTYPYQYAPIVGEYISSRFGGSGILGKSSGTQGVGGVDLAGGIGVRGKSSSGYGIFGECNSGYGIGAMLGYYVGPTWYECKGPIYLQPSKVSGAPTHSANSGTIWVTPETDTPPCVMYVNISSPSPGTTWQKVGAQ